MMTSSTGACSPSQQLGAVPGTAASGSWRSGQEPGAPQEGLQVEVPESVEGEFASSAEADAAPRETDFDEELPDD